MGRSGCKGRGYRAGDSAGVAALKRSMRGELRDTDETDDGRMYRSAGSWSSWAEATDRYCDTSSAWSPDGARPVAPRFLDHRRPLLVTSGQRLPGDIEIVRLPVTQTEPARLRRDSSITGGRS